MSDLLHGRSAPRSRAVTGGSKSPDRPPTPSNRRSNTRFTCIRCKRPSRAARSGRSTAPRRRRPRGRRGPYPRKRAAACVRRQPGALYPPRPGGLLPRPADRGGDRRQFRGSARGGGALRVFYDQQPHDVVLRPDHPDLYAPEKVNPTSRPTPARVMSRWRCAMPRSPSRRRTRRRCSTTTRWSRTPRSRSPTTALSLTLFDSTRVFIRCGRRSRRCSALSPNRSG